MDNNNIDQEDFLQEYIKDKNNFKYAKFSDAPVKVRVYDAFLEIYLLQIDSVYRCEIVPIIDDAPPIAFFTVPDTYEDFKTIIDIFLKGY